MEEIATIIKTKYLNKTGIVYCNKINECTQIASALQSQDIDCLVYHGKMDDEARKIVQVKWSSNVCKIVCATLAFGMGIDKE